MAGKVLNCTGSLVDFCYCCVYLLESESETETDAAEPRKDKETESSGDKEVAPHISIGVPGGSKEADSRGNGRSPRVPLASCSMKTCIGPQTVLEPRSSLVAADPEEPAGACGPVAAVRGSAAVSDDRPFASPPEERVTGSYAGEPFYLPSSTVDQHQQGSRKRKLSDDSAQVINGCRLGWFKF